MPRIIVIFPSQSPPGPRGGVLSLCAQLPGPHPDDGGQGLALLQRARRRQDALREDGRRSQKVSFFLGILVFRQYFS